METTSAIHVRLLEVVGTRTYRAVGELTGHHHETVRRYMRGQPPSVEFVTALCHQLGINAHWLVTGVGPMHIRDARASALAQANPGELLTAIANTLEQLIGRVDRIERYVQTLETRVRASNRGGASVGAGRGAGQSASAEETGEQHIAEPKPAAGAAVNPPAGAAADDSAEARRRCVTDVITKRPRQDADKSPQARRRRPDPPMDQRTASGA